MKEELLKLLKNYKFKASQVGKIASSGRGKTLSDAALTYLSEVFIEILYGRKKEVVSDAIEKGVKNEEQAIKMLSEYLGKELKKNEQTLENEYFVGIPDIITEDSVIDIKIPDSIFSFPKLKLHTGDVLSTSYHYKDYYWQLQVYMDLLGLNKSYLAFVLVDSPEWFLNNLEKRYYFSLVDKFLSEEELEMEMQRFREKVLINYTYPDLELEEKICLVEITKNEQDITVVKEKIDYIRNKLFEEYAIGDLS